MSRSSESEGRGRRAPAFLAYAGLALGLLLLYAPVLGFEFVNFDDFDYVKNNHRVLDGLSVSGAVWAWTTFTEANWHPLTWLSLMLDAEIGGADPAVYHATNLLLHVLNTCLLLHLLLRTTGRPGPSAFVAALFAIHPLHVESVAWIAERKDLLSALFGLLALLAYADYARRGGRLRCALVVACLGLGLLAKPMLVSLPLVLLLLDLWPLGRLRRAAATGPRAWLRLVWEKIPLFALALASSVVTLVAQARGGAMSGLEALPLHARLANAAVACVDYVRAMLWPAGLAVTYPHPGAELPWGRVAASAALLAALSLLAVSAWRKRPYLTVGWLWYLVMLLPVIGAVQVGAQARADRYTYLPLVGLFVAIAWGVAGLLPARGTGRRRAARVVVSAAAVVALMALSAVTRVQLGHWRNGVTLFERALAVTERNARAHNGLGMALDALGHAGRSIEQFREAVRVDPGYAEAHANLAAALAREGRHAEARSHFDEALRLNPEDAVCRANYGTLLMRLGQLALAEVQLTEALRVDPDNVMAHTSLGVLLAREGELERAAEHFSEALRIDPGNEGARRNLERARHMLDGG